MTAPVQLAGSLSLHPVALGRVIHEAGYRALGLPWVYVPFACTDATLEGALIGMRALGIRGFGISMPFKERIVPLVDELMPDAVEARAVNTVVAREGRLIGTNTDHVGAVAALREVSGNLEGARVLVIGAGGAASAVVMGLKKARAEVTIVNRTFAKAEALAERHGVKAMAHEEAGSFDIVVQATSAEMGGQDTLPERPIRLGSIAMDIVYKPLQTPFLRRASELGATTISGERMLLFQAAAQFELYTGRPAPVAEMGLALVRHLGAE